MTGSKVQVPGRKLGLRDDRRKHTMEPYGELWADVTGMSRKKDADCVILYRKRRDGAYRPVGLRQAGLFRKEWSDDG